MGTAVCQNVEGADTTRVLQEVMVQAFAYNRPAIDVPSAVEILGKEQLQRTNSVSFVPTFNMVAGVRMEERSPASYRLAIRGSSLRAPFGVRNVKVYWNGLPLTDAGGNTYLNQIDFNAVDKIEVIKGPGSSLYGAGTGGVLLLSGKEAFEKTNVGVNVNTGSFGLLGYNVELLSKHHTIQFNHLQSNGYRDHTRVIRDMLNWQARFDLSNNQQLSTAIFYSDLFYETPGALTEAEYKKNPKQARPGVMQRDPHVHAKALWFGANHEITWNTNWQSVNGVYGNFVQFENASFRNYERRAEQGGGARSITRCRKRNENITWNFHAGGELQFGFIPSDVYDNSKRDSLVLTQDDELNSTLYMLFLQMEAKLKLGWSITLGASYAKLNYHFIRLSDDPDTEQKLSYSPEMSPRLAIHKRFKKSTSLYVSLSKGFSPPSYAEVYPSEGTFNKQLAPETGINYEVGGKSEFLDGLLKINITAYQFNLTKTIVLRRTTDNADYFINAGSTTQRGLETSLSYELALSKLSLNPWLAYTYQHYRFKEFVRDQSDFSGNELTGVPSQIISGGVDMRSKGGVYCHAVFNYTSAIPLNDANSIYADSYFTLGLKLGYRNNRFDFNLGAENLLDEKYSLGNDINAFGGRYFNVAPGRSFFVGLKWYLR
jgi:iron complex outermembrane recepter protein